MIKKEWVAALRSGKYKQGDTYLKNTTDGKTKFCCLGVACDLVGAKIVESSGAGFIEDHKQIRGIRKVPKVLKGSDGLPELLSKRNDSGRWGFERIANWIENNL